MDDLAQILADLPAQPILVVGDLILDRYIDGDARRVSPEAPVLVFEAGEERYLLGGACNVAANLVALGAQAGILGVIGEDAAGQQLLDLLTDEGIDTAGVISDPSRPTTRKTRYVSKTAQVLRVDAEKRHVVGGDSESAILEWLGQRPFPFAAVLLSDYGKGMLSRRIIEAAIDAAKSVGAPVIVDPKGTNYSKYHGVDLLTPNREEAEAATGLRIESLDDLPAIAARLREITGIRTATVTLGKDGIFFEGEDRQANVLPTQARSVFDVTGAGDTVVATLTMARAAGVPLSQSLQLANLAAGIVVGRFGTWAVSRDELRSMLGAREGGKAIHGEDVVSLAARLRTEGKRVVFTNGCFDILHAGHVDYLGRARGYGDVLIVGVNSDQSVRRQNKGEDRPINTLDDRLAVLAGLEAVDFVVPFDDDTPLKLIEQITPHVLVKGEDWRNKGVVGREWVEAHGGQVVLVPLLANRSTTNVIERIRASAADPNPGDS